MHLTNQTPVPGCFVYTECIQTVIYDSGSKNLFAFLYPFDVIEEKKITTLCFCVLLKRTKEELALNLALLAVISKLLDSHISLLYYCGFVQPEIDQ